MADSQHLILHNYVINELPVQAKKLTLSAEMQLNLPAYPFKIRQNNDGTNEIFDPLRKKYLVLTPEEWVRLHFLQYLILQKKYPTSLIQVEKGISVNKMKKRFDAVVYSNTGKAVVLIEFKSPKIKIDQKVFQQIANYNLTLNVDYLMVSNGLKHFCCKMDYNNNSYEFLDDIPDFGKL